MDPTIIVLLSFLIFMGIAWRLGYRQSMAVLDSKIADIQHALKEAVEAKEAAVQALEEERQRHEDIQEEMKLIARQAEKQAALLREQALRDIDQTINARQQAATDMMERMRYAAVQTIQKEATEMTLAVFEDLVTTRFSATQQEALNDAAIAQIVGQLEERQATGVRKLKRVRSKRSVSL